MKRKSDYVYGGVLSAAMAYMCGQCIRAFFIHDDGGYLIFAFASLAFIGVIWYLIIKRRPKETSRFSS